MDAKASERASKGNTLLPWHTNVCAVLYGLLTELINNDNEDDCPCKHLL